MSAAHTAQLLRLGRQIAGLEQARRSLPAGYLWIGDGLIATLRVEKQRLENRVAMPDLAAGGASKPEPERPRQAAAGETTAPPGAEGPHSSGTEAMSDPLPEPEGATDAPVEAATPRDGEPEEKSAKRQLSSTSPAVPAEPVTQTVAVAQTDTLLPDKEHVLAFLRREQEQKGCVTPRSLQRWNNRRFHNREAAAEVLNRMVDSGDLEWVEPGDVARVRNA
jgi:hypothetical protein